LKTFFTNLILLASLIGYSQENVHDIRFILGEKLDYKIKYGWFKIGEARISVDSKMHPIDQVAHYRVSFNLKTVGWLKIFANLDLDFESFINSRTLQPHHAKRITISSKKSNSQFDEFDYEADSIMVRTYHKEKDEYKLSSFLRKGPHFTDALGTYFYARSTKLAIKEQTRLYIANRIYHFRMNLEDTNSKKNSSYYKLIFPPIKQFPREKKSYAILSNNLNIPLEIKLATNNGNFFFILAD